MLNIIANGCFFSANTDIILIGYYEPLLCLVEELRGEGNLKWLTEAKIRYYSQMFHSPLVANKFVSAIFSRSQALITNWTRSGTSCYGF